MEACVNKVLEGIFMQLDVLKNEEKIMNVIMFLFDFMVPIVACVFVIFFNGGSWIDTIA